MARINIEDSIWSDLRFMKLILKTGDERIAIGAVVLAWKLGQKHWCPSKLPIPLVDWIKAGIGREIIDVGLARETEQGIYICGSESQFAWWFEKHEAGKRSAEVRKRKTGSAQPSRTPVRETPEQTPNTAAVCSTTSRTSSSFSSSSSLNTKDPLLRNGSQRVVSKTAAPQSAKASGQQIQFVIGTYVKAFQGRYGVRVRPDLGGKARGILQRLLRDYSPHELSKLLQVYLQINDDWFKKRTYDIATFEGNIQRVKVSLETGKEDPNNKSWRDLRLEYEVGGNHDGRSLRLAAEEAVESMEE